MIRILTGIVCLLFAGSLAAQTVTCGSPTNTTHCYDDNDATTFLYTSSDGTSALQLLFTAGGIESCCDNVIIYDGADATAPILYSGSNSGDLAGLQAVSSGPNIFVAIDSDGSVSCVAGSGCCTTDWDWNVICLSCTPPSGSAVLGMCTSGVGSMIDVDITSLGDGTVIISNDAGVAPTTVTSLGNQAVGPFAFSSTVTITLENATSADCNVPLAAISVPGACPPANNTCSGAIGLTVGGDLSCASVTAGTVANATASGVNETACGGTEDDDVWFSFVATATSHAIALQNVAGSTTDLYHSVWEGGCGSLTLLAGSCSDPNTSTATGLTIGNTYFLRVYSWTSTSGQTSTFDVCIGTNPPAPANDDCGGAIGLVVNADLSCGDVTAGSIAFSTPSPEDATACGGTEDDDVWFSFVATATSHAIALQNVAGSTTDLYHSVWEGGCGSLTLLVGSCSDPNTSTATGLTIGNTYFLRVYSWTSTSGQTSTFDVCIGTNPPPPAEDNCVGAINIPVASGMCMGISTGNNSGATNSNSDVPAPPAATCSSYAGGDIWFAITVPASGNVTISGANSDGCCSFLWYEIYSGSDCSALTSIGCSDTNAGSDNNDPSTYETVLTALTPSSTIWIRAWDSSNDNGPGDFNFCAYEPTCAAPTVTIPADAIDNANCPSTVDVSISIDNLGDSGSLTITAMDDLGNPAGTGGMVSTTGIFTVTNVPVPQSSWSITIAHESNAICDVVLGPFFLNCPPANDDACSAEALTVNAAETAGVNTYATAQVGEQGGTCWFETTVHNSVWYSFVAPGSGVVTVSTDFAGGTNDDTQLVVYSGDCNDVSTLMAVGCDDDGGTVETFNSIVDVTDLIGGETYLVQVDGYNGTEGTFNIQVTTPIDPAPANDACDSAEDIPNTNGAGAVVGGTFTQSTGGGMPEACDMTSTPDPKDVWYEINTDAGGTLIIQVLPGAGSDVVIAVYNACSTNPGDAEACVDGGGAGVMEEINFTALFQEEGTTSSVRAEDYFLRIYEKTNSGAAFDVSIQGAALPIELSLFEVKATKLGNEVSWTTESEINSDYVNILASPNGSTKWESIGRVESQGDTYDTKDYSLMDLNPHPVTYYRLESVDRDGTVELSTIISIRRDDQRQNMSLYPNPANDVVNVSLTNEIEETVQVRITGLSGQLFADHNVLLKSGLNTLPLDLVGMPTGVYLITVRTSEETYVKKLVRQ